MSSELRIGIIGCGEVAVDTCMAIGATDNASIAMLMDTRPEVLRDLAEMYSAPTTTEVDDVLNNPDVDAVYVATPHDLHVPIGVRAARAGKHILMEKPIATNLADADTLIAACREHDVALGVAFYAQTDANLNYARNLVRAGLLGDIVSVRLTYLGDKPAAYWQGGYSQRVHTDWRTKKDQAGGGVLIMNTIHDLNTMHWVTGLQAKTVYAQVDTLATQVEVEDTVGAVIRFANGAIGSIHAGSALRGGGHGDIRGTRVFGTRGQLILGGQVMAYLAEPPEGGEPNTWQQIQVPGGRGGREAMVAGFVDAVLSGKEPPVTGAAARQALEVVLAAYRSSQEGQPIALPM